jgi:hypothetical protein
MRKIISLLPQKTWEHHHHPSQFGGLESNDASPCDWKIVAFEMSRKMGQEEEPASSRPHAFACDEHKKMKGKNKAPSPSSSSEEEEEDEDDDDDDDDEEYDDQAYTSSFEDEETVRPVRKVMRLIHKINIMGVLLQVEDLLF